MNDVIQTLNKMAELLEDMAKEVDSLKERVTKLENNRDSADLAGGFNDY